MAPAQNTTFAVMADLVEACERGVVIRYEELVEDFDQFLHKLRRVATIDPHVAEEIHRRSRPRPAEDKTSHRRSGAVGDFRRKLSPVTIESLNHTLGAALHTFGYQP